MRPRLRLITILMDSPIEPRCTGMCGALAISPPSASKTAQEKSSRSLMLTECAVACRRTPICSATDMNRLLKISSITGSAAVSTSARSGRAATRGRSRSPRPVTTAPPARFAQGGAQFLGDDGRAVDNVPGPQPGPLVQVHLGPAPAGEHTDPVGILLSRTGRVIRLLVARLRGANSNRQRLDGNRLHDDRLAGHEAGEGAGGPGPRPAGPRLH